MYGLCTRAMLVRTTKQADIHVDYGALSAHLFRCMFSRCRSLPSVTVNGFGIYKRLLVMS